MKFQPKLLIALCGFCLIPFTASANAGTPLMWASMLHLVFGNAFIGLFEGLILAKTLRLGYFKCVLAMVLANYFSSWGGGYFLIGLVSQHLTLNLYNAWFWFWTMAAATFLMTLLLEWPFVFFCLRKQPNRFKKSVWGNLLINSLSYTLLFGWYWSASGTGIYRNMEVVQPQQMTMPTNGVVFFISTNSSDVYALDLTARQSEKVYVLNITNKDNRLLAMPSQFDGNNWDILEDSKSVLVKSNLTAIAAECWRDTDSRSKKETWFDFGDAPKLGSAEASDWNFETGFWPIEGLHGKNSKTGTTMHFSLETPFVAWNARSATHLPGDYVVFQLGEDQICILEASTKKIALLARGYGLVVILKK